MLHVCCPKSVNKSNIDLNHHVFFPDLASEKQCSSKAKPGASESGEADGVARDGWESEKRIQISLTERKRCVESVINKKLAS